MHRSVGLIAIVSVLLHAFAIVRHHAVMMTDALPRSQVAAALDRLPLCGSNSGASTLDFGSSSEQDEPSQRSAPCPVCCGSLAVYAVAPSLFAFLVLPHAGPLEPPAAPDRPRESERRTHPPARGPPATA